MEEERKNIDDSKIKFSGKIKGILAALLFALGSSNFSYAQENDSVQHENKYERIVYKNMDSYIRFDGIEHARQKTIKYRNNIFQMLYQLFKKDERFGFPEFSDFSEEVVASLDGIENEDNALLILNNLKKQLEYDINVEKSIECRKALTKALSIVKDKMCILNGVVDDPIELLKQNLKVGDIILINKSLKDFDIGSDALKFYDEKYLTDFTHMLIFIGFDEEGNIMVRHSTTETERLHKIGVEETSFLSYLLDPDRCNADGCDVIVLRPIPEIRQSILDFSSDKIGCGYDSKVALIQGLGLQKKFDDKYNCVEVVTQGIEMPEYTSNIESNMSFEGELYEKIYEEYYNYLRNVFVPQIRTKSHPNDAFEYLDYFFNMIYICTLNN